MSNRGLTSRRGVASVFHGNGRSVPGYQGHCGMSRGPNQTETPQLATTAKRGAGIAGSQLTGHAGGWRSIVTHQRVWCLYFSGLRLCALEGW